MGVFAVVYAAKRIIQFSITGATAAADCNAPDLHYSVFPVTKSGPAMRPTAINVTRNVIYVSVCVGHTG